LFRSSTFLAKKDIHSEYSPEVKAKTKKNLLWIGIMSIVMFFAGLTSAYLVIRWDNFWVNISMPVEFWISTVTIVISSVTIYLAKTAATKDNASNVKLFIVLTLVLGLAFSYFQYKGWKTLFKSGNAMVGNIVPPGKYGRFFTLSYKDSPLTYKDGVYLVGDQELEGEAEEKIKAFCQSIYKTPIAGSEVKYTIDNAEDIQLFFHNGQPLKLINGQFNIGKYPIIKEQQLDLNYFAENIINERGDFFMNGKYGKDFSISFKGEKLRYENGRLFRSSGELTKDQYAELNGVANKASSFLYLLTGLHFLHLIGGLIFLIILAVRSFRNQYNSQNFLSIQLGGIYWHFLDALWIYLFLFLFFIH